MTEPLVHVIDRLTQVTPTVIGSQQALLYKSFRDFGGGLLVEVAGPDRTLKDRQNPNQDVRIAALHRVRRRNSRIRSHATTMPWPSGPGPQQTRLPAAVPNGGSTYRDRTADGSET